MKLFNEMLWLLLKVLFIFHLRPVTPTVSPQFDGYTEAEAYQLEVETWLKTIDSYLSTFNSMAAYLTWAMSTNPTPKMAVQATELGEARNTWKNRICESQINVNLLTTEQSRKLYLLCRGPKYSDHMSGKFLELMGDMATAYNSEICLPEDRVTPLHLLSTSDKNTSWYPKPGTCLYGEPDLERLMKKNELNPDQKKWIWTVWHDTVGPKLKQLYPAAIDIQNEAAKNNGYNDMGEVWREELEMPDLENTVLKLYEEIKLLYEMLHAVVRHKLLQIYGDSQVDPTGPIPIHLLGNMWGQDWSSLIYLFLPKNETLDLNFHLKNKHWSIKDMVWQAEDMYASLGFPRMTQKFWNFSIFEESKDTPLCHGTAANLYAKDDFRMLLCAQVNMEDFYVIHHEMGHIEYYMAYENQPAIFQDGASSAIHETVGDTIMHAVMTPQHLHRLGLLTDKELRDPSVEQFLLFQQALAKIPEIPYSLLIDKYRWDIFKGKITPQDYNKIYWEMTEKLRGIVAPDRRRHDLFDAGGKFHIPDNTPYIRYFLSSILQMQMYKGMCENMLYGQNPSANEIDDPPLHIPLHKCDLYGSKTAGKKLRKMMERGSSIDWATAMDMVTGRDFITTKPLVEYYKPIYKWLKKYISVYNVPIGW